MACKYLTIFPREDIWDANYRIKWESRNNKKTGVGGWVEVWENEMEGAVTSVFLDTQCLARLLPGRHLTRKCHHVVYLRAPPPSLCDTMNASMVAQHESSSILRWVRISVTSQLPAAGLFLPPVDGVCGMV